MESHYSQNLNSYHSYADHSQVSSTSTDINPTNPNNPTLHYKADGNKFIMAHHNDTLWQIIRQKLQPIAEGEATFGDVSETISFFVNNETFQSRSISTRKPIPPEMTPPQPMKFMLDQFFRDLAQHEKVSYQTTLLPKIAQIVLETEELFPHDKRFSILRQHEDKTITLSKKQCACLIAHMFFCITVDQAEHFKLAKLIDFSVICEKPGLPKFRRIKTQKLRCLFTYFEKVFREKERLDENVVFKRLSLGSDKEEVWMRSYEPMTRAQITLNGGVEDNREALQVVFSDKELGDQVLELPATQQQILSLIHPELMLSLLFCEELKEDETVRVCGAGRYSDYRGYDDTFEFLGPYTEENNKTERQHVIMDAEKYSSLQKESQFDQKWVLRELNKAHSGFFSQDQERRAVATGKWGCGIFKGNPQLKFIIQWLAASRTGREIEFYLHRDPTGFIVEDYQKILKHYTDKDVSDLFDDLCKAAREMQIENMKTDSIQTEVIQTERKKEDEDKNLFKVLIALNGL